MQLQPVARETSQVGKFEPPNPPPVALSTHGYATSLTNITQ